ncbi:MAG TPA: hypothetical protein GXX51_11040 [Firmicutes bacterium]|nr:hypothetical protein [Bacillota bacterium]
MLSKDVKWIDIDYRQWRNLYDLLWGDENQGAGQPGEAEPGEAGGYEGEKSRGLEGRSEGRIYGILDGGVLVKLVHSRKGRLDHSEFAEYKAEYELESPGPAQVWAQGDGRPGGASSSRLYCDSEAHSSCEELARAIYEHYGCASPVILLDRKAFEEFASRAQAGYDRHEDADDYAIKLRNLFEAGYRKCVTCYPRESYRWWAYDWDEIRELFRMAVPDNSTFILAVFERRPGGSAGERTGDRTAATAAMVAAEACCCGAPSGDSDGVVHWNIWTSLIAEVRGGKIVTLTTTDSLPGVPAIADWRRDCRSLVDLCNEKYPPVGLGVFMEVDTLRQFLTAGDKARYLSDAILRGDIIADPAPSGVLQGLR